jgi:hypothetical protein
MDSNELKKLLDEYTRLTGNPGNVSDGMANSLPVRSGIDFQEPIQNEVKQEASNIIDSTPELAQPTLAQLPPSMPAISAGYGVDLSDKAIIDAQEQAKQNRLLAGLSKAGSMAGAAIASRNTINPITADTSISDQLFKDANIPVENLLQRRKAKDDELSRQAKVMDINNDREMQDPNSAVSVALRDAAKLVGLAVPQNVSGAQLKNSGINLGNLLSAHQAAEARKAQTAQYKEERALSREEGKRRFAQNEVRNYQKDAEKEVKELRDQAIASQDLIKMTEEAKTNPIAASSIGVMAAKARGERGALSATDVTRYIENKAAASKIAQWINSAAQGTVTPQNAEFIKDVEKTLQGLYDQRIGESYNRYSERFSQNTGLDLEESMDKVIPQSERKYVDSLTVRVKLPDGRVGTIPRSKLKKALEQGAKEVE